ncbi:hypothetical protein GCM10007897_38440 [Sphingobium jiangsuense]|nr:hypothetical protein GCM10007897_38440 [Sphingobium jiangsuense]
MDEGLDKREADKAAGEVVADIGRQMGDAPLQLPPAMGGVSSRFHKRFDRCIFIRAERMKPDRRCSKVRHDPQGLAKSIWLHQ